MPRMEGNKTMKWSTEKQDIRLSRVRRSKVIDKLKNVNYLKISN